MLVQVFYFFEQIRYFPFSFQTQQAGEDHVFLSGQYTVVPVDVVVQFAGILGKLLEHSVRHHIRHDHGKKRQIRTWPEELPQGTVRLGSSSHLQPGILFRCQHGHEDRFTAAAERGKEAAVFAQDLLAVFRLFQIRFDMMVQINIGTYRKDLTIATLADKLSAAEAKIKGYDDLMQKEAAAQDKIRELQTQVERITSDAQKDTALAVANAVAEKEREFATQLRAADKENARLQARIEILEEQLQAAVNK